MKLVSFLQHFMEKISKKRLKIAKIILSAIIREGKNLIQNQWIMKFHVNCIMLRQCMPKFEEKNYQNHFIQIIR